MRRTTAIVSILLGGCGGASLLPVADGSAPDDSAARGGALDSADPTTPDSPPPGAAPAPDLAGLDAGQAIQPGGFARVIADSLNLRDGPGTTHAILLVMPCGSRVAVAGGPLNGWWNVVYMGQTGWSSGKYLVADAAFDPSVCTPSDGGAGPAPGDGGLAPDQTDILNRCKTAVGYSYYWGHGSWRLDGQQVGACTGNCPACTHTGGSYGADCSGLAAKCWQVPAPSAVTTDLHPYSTANFFGDQTHWMPVPRANLQPADALVYHSNGAGHIALYESGDPWGLAWVYECKGCSWGCVHDLRSFSNTYIAIRREGL